MAIFNPELEAQAREIDIDPALFDDEETLESAIEIRKVLMEQEDEE